MWSTGRKLSKWIDISIEDPLETWRRAKKYFKRPRLRFHTINQSFRAYKRGGRLLEIECWDLQWKDKFNGPRHERSPHISVLLFGKYGFNIEFGMNYRDEFGEKQNGDMEYWEYILSWLFYEYRKTLTCFSCWSGDSKIYKYVSKYGNAEDGSEDEVKAMPRIVPCVAMSLNKEGIKELKRELNEEGRNTTNY